MRAHGTDSIETFLADVQSMKLHVSSAFGTALKKPLLLLLVLARIDRSEKQENRFSFSELRNCAEINCRIGIESVFAVE